MIQIHFLWEIMGKVECLFKLNITISNAYFFNLYMSD